MSSKLPRINIDRPLTHAPIPTDANSPSNPALRHLQDGDPSTPELIQSRPPSGVGETIAKQMSRSEQADMLQDKLFKRAVVSWCMAIEEKLVAYFQESRDDNPTTLEKCAQQYYGRQHNDNNPELLELAKAWFNIPHIKRMLGE